MAEINVVSRIVRLARPFVALVGLVLLMSCGGNEDAASGSRANAGRVFFDDFEDGTTDKWEQDDFRNRCQVVTSANLHGSVQLERQRGL
jgi:hypothetical protein